ncbi:hypothetical protein SAMN04488514_1122 [Kriegella aquimaris]|uniref:Uncharacterized protein n=1 Tax=Kriegella aquimaris TaxID=192904 RepID=A0A1G9UW06_9FLAO|nr:hypothetical protein SAMN04488514_1122 [Kriegella aquimaris]
MKCESLTTNYLAPIQVILIADSCDSYYLVTDKIFNELVKTLLQIC